MRQNGESSLRHVQFPKIQRRLDGGDTAPVLTDRRHLEESIQQPAARTVWVVARLLRANSDSLIAKWTEWPAILEERQRRGHQKYWAAQSPARLDGRLGARRSQ